MGISGLLPLLKEIQVSGNIADFKGKRLAVDAYVWLHRGAFGCAEDLVKGKKTTRFVDYAMHRVRMLTHHNITPFVVFDGGPLPAKRGTEESREKSRADNLARAQAFDAQGRWKEARDCYTKCVDITPEMAYQLIKALKAEGIEYVVSPYEADAQLCYLESKGHVDGIITEDSDLLVFGCKTVIFKLEKDGSCVSIDRTRLTAVRDLPMHGWTDLQFRRMAMLSGCDYLPSIPGIGLKKAHRMLRRYKTVEKLLQGIRLEGSHTIPRDYLSAFQQAEMAFIYQRVFCPHKQCLVPLSPFPEEGLKDDDEKWIGLDVSEDVARGIAQGDLHPETRRPINDLWPDYQPGSKAGGSKPPVKGTLDSFFTSLKRTKSAPIVTPVGRIGSGVTTLAGLANAGGLGRHRSEPTPPPAVVKTSKHFGSKNKQKDAPVPDTPKTQFSLHWEESDAVPTQVDPPQSRSPSPEYIPSSPVGRHIGSLSPAVSTARHSLPETPSRLRVRPVHDDALTSPFSHVSSPPAQTPPDSMDRALDGAFDDEEAAMSRPEPLSPTPTPTRALIRPSSQMATIASTPASVYPYHSRGSSMATIASSPSATPLPRTKMRSLTSVLVPASSPSLRTIAATAATKASSSSGSFPDGDIITPTADSLPRRRGSRPKRARETEDEVDTAGEVRARTVGQGWSSKWSLGSQMSSSPVASDCKRQAIPLSATAPRILTTTKTLNASTPIMPKSYAAATTVTQVVSPLVTTKPTKSKGAENTPLSFRTTPAPKHSSRPAHTPTSQPHGLSVNALERFRYSRK